jgi:hypothetical protein
MEPLDSRAAYFWSSLVHALGIRLALGAPRWERHPASRHKLGAVWLYAEERLANRDGWEINL